MSDLSLDQFHSVFSQMDQMDKQYPGEIPEEHKNASFFHGTTHNITDGMVRPANHVDKYPSEASMGDPGDMSEGDHAFAVRNDENYAWHAAHVFHQNGRRPRVYQVDPAPDMKPGPWNKDHPDFLAHHELDDPKDYTEPAHDSDDRPVWEGMVEDAESARATQHQDEWGSPTGFPVRKRIDIMPGRQGTFPTVNWNKYKDPNTMSPRTPPDANHPSDIQEKFGMGGITASSTIEKATPAHLNGDQFYDWQKDPAPHSVLREEMGLRQKPWATLF